MAFAAVLGPMAPLSALQANVFVSLPLSFCPHLLATFALGILALALALVLPAVLLVERGPTSGISVNSTTSASRALCPSPGYRDNPHT